jgi:thiaminase/transcriptional activator TenA
MQLGQIPPTEWLIMQQCNDSLKLSPSLSLTKTLNVLPSKTTLEYTSYLDQVSSNGSLGEILSAVAPCHWIYLEIAEKLSESDHTHNNKIYKKWVQFNSSDESRGQLNELFYRVMTF